MRIPVDPLSFAIRVWHYQWEWEPFGGLQVPMQLGDAGLTREWQSNQWHELFWVNTQFTINCLVCLLAGLGSLVLFILRRPTGNFSGSACGRPSTSSMSF